MHPPLQYPTNTFPILKVLLPISLSCSPRSSQPTPLFFKSPVCCRLLPSGLIFQSPSSSGVHGSAETVADRQCRELERELALLWAPAAALGQPDCALAPSSLSLVPMTSSSLPRGLPAGATAGASSLQIWFWDSDVHSFLRIPQVAQTEWLPVSPKSPGIWPQTKFAWGQYSASPRPAGRQVPWLREQSHSFAF